MKKDVRDIRIKYISDDINFESYAKLNIQGSSSLKYDKKNYNITFYKDEECTKKESVDFKWGKFNKYTLKANWIDPLYFRNIITAQIDSQINKKYGIFENTVNYGLIDGYPIEIYINDEFLGLYTLNIAKKNIFNLDEKIENNIFISAKKNTDATNFLSLETLDWEGFEVEIGQENEETLDKLNRLISFVKDSSDEEFLNDFEKHFNLDSLLNYYCIMHFAQLTDNINKNLCLITYDGQIWYTALYDLDISWGNKNSWGERRKYDENIMNLTKKSILWSRFEKTYWDEICDRYNELRKTILIKENVINKVKNFYSLIPQETLNKEYKKWNNKAGYNLEYLYEYLDTRISTVDRIIKK